MTQLNDCKFLALRDLGYSGAIDDMEKAWGVDNGLPEGTVGVPWHNALANAGYAGQINDIEFQFWCVDGGSFGLKALRGWTDGVDCDGSGNYPVEFSKEVTFTDHTDVNFVKNLGLAGEETILATSATVSPATTIVYDAPAWAVALVAGDTITLVIGVGSNYWGGDYLPSLYPNKSWDDFPLGFDSEFDAAPAGWVLTGVSDAANKFQKTADGMRCLTDGATTVYLGTVNSGNLPIGTPVDAVFTIFSLVSGKARVVNGVNALVLDQPVAGLETTLQTTVASLTLPFDFSRNNVPTDLVMGELQLNPLALIADQSLLLDNCLADQHADYNFWLPGGQTVGDVLDQTIAASYPAIIQPGTNETEVWANTPKFTTSSASDGNVTQALGAGAFEFGLGTESMILAFRITAAPPAVNGAYIGQSQAASVIGYRIGFLTDGKMSLTFDDGTSSYSLSPVGGNGAQAVVLDNTEHQITVALDGPTKTAYFWVDGEPFIETPTHDFSAIITSTKSTARGFGWGAIATRPASMDAQFEDCHCLIRTGGLPLETQDIVDHLFNNKGVPVPEDFY